MRFMPLLAALIIVLAVNLLTAAFQSWHSAIEDPIKNLKNE